MNPNVEKILERLAYEKLLLTSPLEPKKRIITLQEVLDAAKEEPRIGQVLPAILIYKPKILKGIARDLKKYPELERKAKTIFDPNQEKKDFLGVSVADCRKAALTFQNYLRISRQKTRHRLFNLRLNDDDWQALEKISKTRGITNYSDIVRTLIHESQ